MFIIMLIMCGLIMYRVVVGQPSPQITCYPQPVTCPPQYTSCPPQYTSCPPQPVRYYPKSATGPRCHVGYQPCPPQPLTRPPRAVQHPRPAQVQLQQSHCMHLYSYAAYSLNLLQLYIVPHADLFLRIQNFKYCQSFTLNSITIL